MSQNAASNVSFTIQVPSGLAGSALTGKVAIASCTLAGCSISSNGTSCAAGTTTSITCTVGNLASILKLTGAVAQITIPVSKTAAVGTYTISGTVNSANDPKPKNNTITDKVTITAN